MWEEIESWPYGGGVDQPAAVAISNSEILFAAGRAIDSDWRKEAYVYHIYDDAYTRVQDHPFAIGDGEHRSERLSSVV